MPQLVYLLGSRVFKDQRTFQGNWLLEASSPTAPSSPISAAQIEPYIPVKSADEGIDGSQFDKIKRCAVSYKCC